MKLQNYSIVLILLFLSFSLRSIGQDISKENLTGRWIFNYEASIELMNEKSKIYYEKMDAIRQERVEQVYRNRIVNFEINGNYTQELFDGRTANGKWSINKNNLIEISSPNGNTISYKIKELSSSVLIMSRVKTDDSKMNMLMSDWYLTRG